MMGCRTYLEGCESERSEDKELLVDLIDRFMREIVRERRMSVQGGAPELVP